MKKFLITLAVIYIVFSTTAFGGGSKMSDEDAIKTFVAIIIFIIIGVLIYFLFKHLKNKMWPTVPSPQEDYNRPIKIHYELLKIIAHGFFGVMFLSVGISLFLIPYRNDLATLLILLIFPLIGIYVLSRFVRLCIESITLDKENIILSRVFSTEIIPIKNISTITLHVPNGKGVNIYITFGTKGNRSYKWFCDSFESADRITVFIQHWVPDVLINETAGFQSKRGLDNFLRRPRGLFDLFNKKKKD